ncbi:restriction endonuclease subunit S [Planktothrix agardhii]|jgi:type I restriction enzyme S subunit|uniref:restriction endonuclease subunit S n=1 Tax=Planktothrix agardhii TaxID=1160 RepID=UPI001F2CF680|nr:restriction endonuclease subunit S [Planktothrix agardhii]MCF3578049.1 restriction endonuclease subunit S [Planktothrix agardhii 1812]MCF3581893.1 restriction endonuclease subunit S [Planktothrix agardhii 1811]
MELVRLENICDIKSGGTPSRNEKDNYGGLIPWAKISDIEASNGNLFTTEETITEKGLKAIHNRIFDKGTLLFAMYGSVGKIAFTQVKVSTNQAILGINIKDESKLYDRYLYYWLLRKKHEFLHLANGVTQKNLSTTFVRNLEIPLPPIASQRRIADILDKADEIIRKRKEAIALTEQLLKSTFLDMFGDPVINPKGWEVKKLGNICTIVRGGSPRPINDYLGGTIPWIKIGDATEGDDIYIHKTAEMIKEEGIKKSRYLEPNTLIFANCGVSLGFARILKIGGCIHDGWLAFSHLNSCINQIFLLKSLNQITQYFRSIAPDGTQPNLNTTIMKNFNIPVPPIDSQEKFENIIEQILKKKIKLKESLEESENLFNSLLQKAFKGEL